MLGRKLKDSIDHDFFRWFHLARYEAPRDLADGATWHGFRPEGAKFRELVTVNLETDGTGRIADAKLCLDRAFIEHPKDGAFARDITASFLRWILPEAALSELGGFLRELGDLGPNVIRIKGAPNLTPAAEPSVIYRVYLGQNKDGAIDLSGVSVRLTNLQAREGPRDPLHDWIWIRVVPGATA
jgi:hypothetical protein